MTDTPATQKTTVDLSRSQLAWIRHRLERIKPGEQTLSETDLAREVDEAMRRLGR